MRPNFSYFQRRQSSKQHVVLKSVSLKSAGRYKVRNAQIMFRLVTQPHPQPFEPTQCEVSGEAPSFKTKTDSEDMVVVVTPEKGPFTYDVHKVGGWRSLHQKMTQQGSVKLSRDRNLCGHHM